MHLTFFVFSLAIALICPILAVSYLKPILYKILVRLCEDRDGAAFWIKSAYLLAVSGTLILMLCFGRYDAGAEAVEVLRRALTLVVLAVFLTVSIIAWNIWGQVKVVLDKRRAEATLLVQKSSSQQDVESGL